MIRTASGTLDDKRPNQVLVDVAGVGYLVHIPAFNVLRAPATFIRALPC